jgi:NAD(P)-dependent dehydrogenase (short-subunit alcohol dehydrogenase family)
MASELADSGIRVNAVAPGTMRTADNLAHMKDAKLRWVELADLVSAVLFLAGDEAKGISGEVVPVTGGGR